MALYVTLVKFTPEGMKSIGDFANDWEAAAEKGEEMGIKTVGAYGLLGPFDMMFVYEAPDEKVAASVPLFFSSLKGGAQTETWTAIPMRDFAQLTGRVKD